MDAGTGDPYAYYRLACLLWRGEVEHDTLVRVEQLLSQAIRLNTRFASAYSMVGEARAALGSGDPMAMVLRAIALDPGEPHYYFAAANVLWRQDKIDEAIQQAKKGQALADTDEERRRAADLLDRLARAKRQ